MTSSRQGYREQASFWQGLGENGGGQEWGEGIVHVGGEEIMEAVHHTRPSLKVGQGAVISLSTSLDEVVNVQGIYVVEEGAILQSQGQGPVVCKVAMDS